jgi:hypothetical protein
MVISKLGSLQQAALHILCHVVMMNEPHTAQSRCNSKDRTPRTFICFSLLLISWTLSPLITFVLRRFRLIWLLKFGLQILSLVGFLKQPQRIALKMMVAGLCQITIRDEKPFR